MLPRQTWFISAGALVSGMVSFHGHIRLTGCRVYYSSCFKWVTYHSYLISRLGSSQSIGSGPHSLLGSSPLLCTGLTCACSVVQLCPTLCDPMDWSLPGSSVHGISQARILGWIAISSRGSSQPRDWTFISCTSCTGREIVCHWASWKACCDLKLSVYYTSLSSLWTEEPGRLQSTRSQRVKHDWVTNNNLSLEAKKAQTKSKFYT